MIRLFLNGKLNGEWPASCEAHARNVWARSKGRWPSDTWVLVLADGSEVAA